MNILLIAYVLSHALISSLNSLTIALRISLTHLDTVYSEYSNKNDKV
jgi:hypothetical protein